MRTASLRDVYWVAALCGMLLLVLLPYYSFNAVLLLVQREWGLSSGEAGFVSASAQIGYVVAVVLLLPLTDRVRPSYVLLGSTLLSMVGSALFPLLGHGLWSGALFRALGGAGLAGAYMPGLRLISERFPPERRGGPIGLYVAAFVLGGAVSFGLAASLVPSLGWRGAYLATAVSGVGAVLLTALLVRDEGDTPPPVRSRREGVSLGSVLGSKPLMLITAGYTGHVWELFGMRAWLAPFLATILMRSGGDVTSSTAQAAFLASLTILLGTLGTVFSGTMSDRLGRTATAAFILTISGVCSLVLGWLVDAPLGIILGVCMVYGLTVNPDSPVYSTGVTELAPRERLGAAMAFQTTAGWSAGIVSPIAFGMILDSVQGSVAWGLGFGCLGLGAVGGIVALLALRRSKESALLAGGRR